MRTEFKAHIEALTSLSAFPNVIPKEFTENVSVLMYRVVSNNRNKDSALAESDIKDWTFDIFVLARKYVDMAAISDTLVDSLDGFTGLMGDKKVLKCRISRSMESYDNEKKLHENSLSVNVILNRN